MRSIDEVIKLARKIVKTQGPVILTGPPGAGKTMVAQRVADLMPPPTHKESDEIRAIYRVAGLVIPDTLIRPFRAPHHTVSIAGMCGRRPNSVMAIPYFGEMSLAHNGVLFLDDLQEFPWKVLDAVADAVKYCELVHGTRSGNVYYPADFKLVCAIDTRAQVSQVATDCMKQILDLSTTIDLGEGL